MESMAGDSDGTHEIFVFFCSFNDFARFSDGVLDVWNYANENYLQTKKTKTDSPRTGSAWAG